MKYTLILLLLSISFAISSPIPPHMLKKTPAQLKLIFYKNKILERKIKEDRGAYHVCHTRHIRHIRHTRKARDCRFCLRAMPKTRKIRITRVQKEEITGS